MQAKKEKTKTKKTDLKKFGLPAEKAVNPIYWWFKDLKALLTLIICKPQSSFSICKPQSSFPICKP
ncbi:hypothetical protein ACSAZL_03780 [Methanosarcina sp. T3]|uniref:hypothetical protein n=1 Tax=Methanosarcina sp. T3 TaxID=3439062 RepID=UPI003F8673E3